MQIEVTLNGSTAEDNKVDIAPLMAQYILFCWRATKFLHFTSADGPWKKYAGRPLSIDKRSTVGKLTGMAPPGNRYVLVI